MRVSTCCCCMVPMANPDCTAGMLARPPLGLAGCPSSMPACCICTKGCLSGSRSSYAWIFLPPVGTMPGCFPAMKKPAHRIGHTLHGFILHQSLVDIDATSRTASLQGAPTRP